jgi:hyperosmotically inducible protein
MKRLALFIVAGALWAQQPAPDNTKTNTRDAKTSTPITAGQQGNSKADTALTAKIRKSIMSDKSLSTYAHNVKIVTINGEVTLRGPVRSEDEKRVVQTLAETEAGSTHVINHLEIAPAKLKKTAATSSK